MFSLKSKAKEVDSLSELSLSPEDVNLSSKIMQLIREVRKEVRRKYQLDKDLENMTWDEKIKFLNSESWMMEQVLTMLERFVERQTGKKKGYPPRLFGRSE